MPGNQKGAMTVAFKGNTKKLVAARTCPVLSVPSIGWHLVSREKTPIELQRCPLEHGQRRARFFAFFSVYSRFLSFFLDFSGVFSAFF